MPPPIIPKTSFLKESIRCRAGSERVLWILLLLFVAAISFSIAVSHIFLSAATCTYLFWKFRHDRRFPRAPILAPALAFAYCIFLSVIFSIHPSQSLFHAKELVLFIIVPLFYDEVKN